MISATQTYPTLAQGFLRGDNAMLRKAALVALGSVALWISAKIQVPFYPVPLTMQTFIVLAIGMAFGMRLGALTVALYLAEGMLGLPVFAGTPEKGIGLAYMVGPTGGYLLGYLVAAGVVGFLAERGFDRSVAKTAVAMMAGNLVIYAFGLLWLGAIVGWDKPVLAWGMTPFLLGDGAKLLLAAMLLPAIWRVLGSRKI